MMKYEEGNLEQDIPSFVLSLLSTAHFCVACVLLILIHEHNLKTANCICLCKINDHAYCLLIPVYSRLEIIICIIKKIKIIMLLHG